jgi:hypothetical protein
MHAAYAQERFSSADLCQRVAQGTADERQPSKRRSSQIRTHRRCRRADIRLESALPATGCFQFCTLGQAMLPVAVFVGNLLVENKELPGCFWPTDASGPGQSMVQVTERIFVLARVASKILLGGTVESRRSAFAEHRITPEAVPSEGWKARITKNEQQRDRADGSASPSEITSTSRVRMRSAVQ